MKKNLKILLIGILTFLPLTVKAASLNISLSCPSSANANSEISCTITATPNGYELRGLQANYIIENGTYKSFNIESGWTSYASSEASKKGFSVAKNNPTSTATKVGTLKLTMPSSGTLKVKIDNVESSDPTGNTTIIGNSPQATIRVKSTVNTLDSLTVSGATLNFNKNTTTYNVTVNEKTTTISATKTDSYSTMSGTGTKNLNYGNNKFEITVTSETGSKKVYTINVNRPDNRSTNNNLSNIKLSSGTLSFNKNTTTYNVEVDGKIDKIKVEATLEDSKSSFVSNYGPKEVKLNYGKNTITLKVKAENGSEKTYTINVTRKDTRSTNANLKSLKLSSGTISFNKNTTTYNVEVDNKVEKVKIEATLEDSKSSFVNNYGPREVSLKSGKNTVILKVKAENESEKTYTINITRKDDRNSNNNLKSLKLSSGTLPFNKDQTEYQVTVDKTVEKITIEALPEDSKATVKYDKEVILKAGTNIVEITVTAENESSKVYKLNIVKLSNEIELDSNNNLKEITIVGHNIDFNKETISYNLKLTNEQQLSITALPESEKAIVSILGNNDLRNGSTITINVTAEDGTTKEYKINIIKDEIIEEKNSNNTLLIPIAVFGFGALMFIIALIVKKKKNNQ